MNKNSLILLKLPLTWDLQLKYSFTVQTLREHLKVI